MGFVLALVAALWGCQCQPQIPTPPEDTETTTTGETANTGDTAPPPPCAVPEVEPNDNLDAPNVLVLEKQACGQIGQPLDLDWWSFSLTEDHWVEIELEAGNGSIADMSILLTAEGETWAAARADDPGSRDATLRFPAPAGTYVLNASDQNFDGGDRYDYDLLVSEAKPPVEWSDEEAEPNDDQAGANVATAGAAIWGVMDGNGILPDYDWFQVAVPTGKHTLSVDVVAYAEGSAADLTVYLYDAALDKLPAGCKDPCPQDSPACVECAITGGVGGEALDPIGAYESEGGEIVYVQVLEATNREGPAGWYVLTIGLEGT